MDESGHWTLGPVAPLRETSSQSVWTGEELLSWSAFSSHDTGAIEEFAAYDPQLGQWRSLPKSGLETRESESLVWTGSEVIVWGGYNPAGNRADGASFGLGRRGR
jgi:hypothetical protein